MAAYLARRCAISLVTLAGVVTVAFFLIRAAPGGPFDGERRLPPQVEANLRAAYHLDEPLLTQYGRYVLMLCQGDLGPSFRSKDFTVNELIGSGLPVSLGVGGIALALAAGLGVAAGAVAGRRPGGRLDRGITLAATAGVALPPIVTAPLLALLFAVTLGWLPAAGFESPRHVVLPAVALALPYLAAFARLTRGEVAEALTAPHVVTARAKGLPGRRIVVRHVLPTALKPAVSFLGPAAAALLAGSMVVEEVFALPGLGRHFVQGALNRDYTLVLGTVIVYAGLILAFNLAVDVLLTRLDPRIRIAQ